MAHSRRALISVSDKAQLLELASGLKALGFELVSTGGTAAALRNAGIEVTEVSTTTGFPEIMDGRVKTLHPAIHAGLLARRGIDDAVLAEHGIGWFDLLAVNLYPFEQVSGRPGCTDEEAIEHIDVGGPAMLRAAAKNHARMVVIVDPRDYERVLVELTEHGEVSSDLKRELAQKTFAHTARYDSLIANFLAGKDETALPELLVHRWQRVQALRYGENPHQQAALYQPLDTPDSQSAWTQLQGKALSYNNLLDADTALACVNAFETPACVIVKHMNPCGVATAESLEEAYRLAYLTDPTSAFGGVIAFNQPLDGVTAAAITGQQHVDVIVAPSIEPAAREALERKRSTRVLERVAGGSPARWEMRSIGNGLLVQERDRPDPLDAALEIVSRRAPTEAELAALRFAWTVALYVKSNAIVYASAGRTLGIGAGQMSRVVSAKIAAMKAHDEDLDLRAAVMASDAFFPFRDGIDVAAGHGIRAVIQPGGSVRDQEVIDAANEHDMAMVLTGIRHFRH